MTGLNAASSITPDTATHDEVSVIATGLIRTVRQNVQVDWWRRDDVRKKMRVSIRRILRKHGFPPDLQADAIKKVVRQAEVLAKEVA
jgi:type I restriction enzyme R subunit